MALVFGFECGGLGFGKKEKVHQQAGMLHHPHQCNDSPCQKSSISSSTSEDDDF